jgi:hypothetical protein
MSLWTTRTIGLIWPGLVTTQLLVLLPLRGLAMARQNILSMVTALNVHIIATYSRSPWAIGQGKHWPILWIDSWFTIQESNMLYLHGLTTKRRPFTVNASARSWGEIISVLPRRSISWLRRKPTYQGFKLDCEFQVTDVAQDPLSDWIIYTCIQRNECLNELYFHVWTMSHSHLGSLGNSYCLLNLTWYDNIESWYNISKFAGLPRMNCNEVVKRRGFNAGEKSEVEWFDIDFQSLSRFPAI